MKLQRLLSLLRQAIDQYNMIEDGDHIAIGISGGKDSQNLFFFLLLPLIWVLIPWIWKP